MINLGNIVVDDLIQIPFNTFDANGASVTVTNLAAGDVHIHKDGGVTHRSSSAGVTVSIDFDTVTGNHLISIDLSDNTDAGFYASGSDYTVRLEGITVATQTINAWIGMFSIENRFDEVDVTKLGGVTQSAADLKDFADAGYDPATNKVEGVKLSDTTTTNTDMVTEPPTAIQNRQEMDSNSTQLTAISTDTNELQVDWVNGGRLDLLLDAIKAVTDLLPDSGALNDLALILADTGTDGVVLANAAIDAIFTRASSNYEGSGGRNLAGAIAKLTNKVAAVGSVLEIKKTDDSTNLFTQNITINASADPITELDTV